MSSHPWPSPERIADAEDKIRALVARDGQQAVRVACNTLLLAAKTARPGRGHLAPLGDARLAAGVFATAVLLHTVRVDRPAGVTGRIEPVHLVAAFDEVLTDALKEAGDDAPRARR